MAEGGLSPLGGIELSLSDYLAIVFRQRWILLGCFLATLAAAGIWTALTPAEYQSTSAVVLRTSINQSVFPSVGATQNQQFLRQPAAEIEYASSTAFASIANESLPTSVTVSPRYDNNAENRSSQLEFIARSTDPEAALTGASAWALTYLEQRAQGVFDDIQATILGIEAQVAELEAQKSEILEPLAPIEQALLTETDSDTISRLTTQRLSLRESLSDDLLPVELQLRTLVTDLSRLRISASFASDSDVSARMSIEPQVGRKVAPNVARNLSLASILGLLVGFGVALLSESLRSVVNSADDLRSLAPSIDVLAELPEFPKNTTNILELAEQVGSPYAESLERIVNVLLYARVQNPNKRMRVLVTSALPSEGKTTVAAHLAMRLGFTHTDTVLIDADLRRPTVHKALQLDRGQRLGLNRLLHEGQPLAPELLQVPDTTVRVLAAGVATNDAAALLRESFGPAIDALPTDYDILLVDAPPVLVVTDAEVLSESVDGIIVVVRAGETPKSKLNETLNRLYRAGAPVLGFVLVAADARSFGRTYGYDYKAYGAAAAPAAVPAATVAAPRPADAPVAELGAFTTRKSVATTTSNGNGQSSADVSAQPALVPGWSEDAAKAADSAAQIHGIRVQHEKHDLVVVANQDFDLADLATAIGDTAPDATLTVGPVEFDEEQPRLSCTTSGESFTPDAIVTVGNNDARSTDKKRAAIHPATMALSLVRATASFESLAPSGLMTVGALVANAGCFQQVLSDDLSTDAHSIVEIIDRLPAKQRELRLIPNVSRGSEFGHGSAVEAVQIHDQVVLYNYDRGTATLLNRAASTWWVGIDGKTPPTSLTTSMAADEVARLTKRLAARGFVELADTRPVSSRSE